MTFMENQKGQAVRSHREQVPSNPSNGFTLIELMIVLAVIAVALSIALPGFSTLTLTTRLKSYANDMVGSMYLARGEAIKRNTPTTLCVSADGITCAGTGLWSQGWVVIASDGTLLRYQQPLANGFKFSGTGSPGSHTLTFQPSGSASTTTTMTLCRKTPTSGHQEKVVTLSVTGRTNVSTTTTGTCS